MQRPEKRDPSGKCRSLSAERGVSLVELMISMTLGLLVIGAMTTIFINNSQSRRELDKAAQQLENGRYAMQILEDEISLAGYYTTLSIVDSPPSTTASPCSADLDVWKASMDIAVEGVNAGNFACIASSKAGTGMLFVQRASTAITAPGALDANRGYLQVSLCGNEYVSTTPDIRFKIKTPGAGVFNLKQIDCAANLAPVHQYIRRVFFVDQNNVAGDGIPTLKRVDFSPAGAGTAVALVEGIDDLHFEYALDTSGDGSPDLFSEAPAANQLINIVGVRVWLIARAIDPSPGYLDAKTYQLGSKDPIAPGDAFKRHVFNTYVELTHPVARRTK
ncbi:PilW family protein [Aromatoleum diolicum]|uniref:Type IV pilus assembly protein PilW n=1 Tax=Aromatoleum diolicum TaxID=75796 RepID=A0ABX1Q8A7_9RHOO|nr:PilW family protein [Aromatoleum diolicum]NMG74523.1 hypothetical protein [Aromatoleum diolicum]